MNPSKLLAGTILSISFAIGIPDLCHAQTLRDVLEIDLAGNRVREVRRNPGSYSIRLTNMIPGRKYRVEVGPSAPRDVPHLDLGEDSVLMYIPESDGACPKLNNIGVNLRAAQSESDVPGLLAQIGDLLTNCTDSTIKAMVSLVISSTTEKVAGLTVEVEGNSRRPITVHRLDQAGANTDATWPIVIFSPGGSWQRTYGWMFAPNRDKEYFAKPPNPATAPDGSGGAPGSEDSPGTGSVQNEITEGTHAENSLTSLPAVFWTWLSPGQRSQPIQHGPTAGLGVALSAVLTFSLS